MIARRGPDPFEGIVFATMRKAVENRDPTLAVLVASLVTAHDAADRAVGAYEAILTRAGKTAGMDAALNHYFGDAADAAKGWRCALSPSDTPTDRPPSDPPGRDQPPPSAPGERPSYGDLSLSAEFEAVEMAWDEIIGQTEDGARQNLAGHGLLAWLFSACCAGSYEGAELDPPGVSVLRACRESVEGWAHSHSGSTIFAEVSYADLGLLARRLDAGIVLVKAQASILRRRAEKVEKMGGAP